MTPGDYTVRFNFNLPADLPSSVYYKGKSRELNKIKVKYFIKASISYNEGEELAEYKQVLVVRERALLALESLYTISEVAEIKTWGCLS